jgi:hypothetical protein
MEALVGVAKIASNMNRRGTVVVMSSSSLKQSSSGANL